MVRIVLPTSSSRQQPPEQNFDTQGRTVPAIELMSEYQGASRTTCFISITALVVQGFGQKGSKVRGGSYSGLFLCMVYEYNTDD
jgi:hypothetical protein